MTAYIQSKIPATFIDINNCKRKNARALLQSIRTQRPDQRICVDYWRIRSKAAPHSGASRHPNPEHAGR